jgi:hypothetical protein
VEARRSREFILVVVGGEIFHMEESVLTREIHHGGVHVSDFVPLRRPRVSSYFAPTSPQPQAVSSPAALGTVGCLELVCVRIGVGPNCYL